MKKRSLALATLLIVMATLRYALGQDESAIGWDAVAQDPMQDVAAVMIAAPILGMIFGAFRLLRTNSARPVLESLRLR